MPENTTSSPELSRISSRADVPPDGKTVIIEASDDECAAVTKRLGVVAVHMLRAELQVDPWRRQGLRVAGTLTASITQQCVVSLEEFDLKISEEINARFAEADDPILQPGSIESEEILVDPLGEDEPDVLSDHGADLGELVVEHLSVAIDPHPRAPGVDFEETARGMGVSVSGEDDEKPESPFAVLAALKQEQDGN